MKKAKIVLSDDLENALRRHQPDTRTVVTKLVHDFSEPILVSILENPEYQKTREIYAALYRVLLREGHSVPDIHRFFIEKIGYTRNPGIFPPDDPSKVDGLPVYLNDELLVGLTTSPPRGEILYRLPKGTRGMVDLAAIRLKSMKITLSRDETSGATSLPALVRFAFPTGHETILARWEDIEPVLDEE